MDKLEKIAIGAFIAFAIWTIVVIIVFTIRDQNLQAQNICQHFSDLGYETTVIDRECWVLGDPAWASVTTECMSFVDPREE